MGAPNTPSILEALQSIGQGLQVNGLPAFDPANVTIGIIKDIIDRTPALEFVADDDQTQKGRLAMGGSINDGQDFTFEITAGLADAEGTELLLAQLRDAITQKFHSMARLNDTPGVQHSALASLGKRGYKYRNGNWFRCYTNKVHVRYEYVVDITP